MKNLFAALFVLGTLTLASCNGEKKTESTDSTAVAPADTTPVMTADTTAKDTAKVDTAKAK